MERAQRRALEQALAAAIVALEQRGDLARRLHDRMAKAGIARSAERYEEQARLADRHAREIRHGLESLSAAVVPPTTEEE
jgi:hypothetical protein